MSGDAADLLRRTTVWRDGRLATLHWWSDPGLLAALGPALAGLRSGARPTVVAGVQSSGFLLAPLVAVHLGVGMLGVQKLPRDGGFTLATAEGCPARGDRVLLVDDVVETGAQAGAVRDLVLSAGAEWLGMSALVAYRPFPSLGLRALCDIDSLRPPIH
ncbi:MAG TPA: phosphoribosyltransferase family protein [Stackebrandtia sp.]|uniref:phosphoribosyltransferase family protein n=1 Tax=Stackebrandtia sp. TaxID=2023065 RepID=UPI002D2E28E6|nr:phosphoribosyltransferase family protein [Stackebrandtia sp.]HZE37516.1 phosphoribosyltransferase family protein [Stackebrandtia sp.]